jgi:hypothetical protein
MISRPKLKFIVEMETQETRYEADLGTLRTLLGNGLCVDEWTVTPKANHTTGDGTVFKNSTITVVVHPEGALSMKNAEDRLDVIARRAPGVLFSIIERP